MPDYVSKNFVHLILPPIRLQTRHSSTQDFQEDLILKDKSVQTILDLMSHHTSVSNCFPYLITIVFCYYRSFDTYRVFMHFYPKTQQHMSVKDI